MKYKIIYDSNKEVFILGPVFVKNCYSNFNKTELNWFFGLSFGFWALGFGSKKGINK